MSARTEAATPKKLRDARRRGEGPRSRELASAVVLLAIASTFLVGNLSATDAFAEVFQASLIAIDGPPGAIARVLVDSVLRGAAFSLPVLLVGAAAGFVIMLLQVGPMISPDALRWRWERLDPVRGARQLASGRRAVELLKAIALLGVVSLVSFRVLHTESAGIFGLVGRAPEGEVAILAMGKILGTLFMHVGVALLGIGALDMMYQRWRFARDQRMTKDEVRREHKESEGDAGIRQERQRVHREILEHQMMEAVRSADVLIVNPTHIAVALQYDRDREGAPQVVARGQEHLARRMIDAAQRAGVPVFRDVPLARSLFRLELGEEIPEGLFDAVAAVLHAAWQERESSGEDL